MGHEFARFLYGACRSLECIQFKAHGNSVFIDPGGVGIDPCTGAGGIISEFHKVEDSAIIRISVTGSLDGRSQAGAAGIDIVIEWFADRKHDPAALDKGKGNGMTACGGIDRHIGDFCSDDDEFTPLRWVFWV